ncbi:MAG: protein phosphatase 2C domain-containing protein [Kiritimatiellae bacterium]|nr:protein phosphatase 2C domain-containing protein [Kiritimatiellia bacterium]
MGFPYLSSTELSDVGRKRKNNEDATLRLPEHGVFCVADGMGGALAGEVASQAAVTAVREEFEALASPGTIHTAAVKGELVARALNRASRFIKQRSDERGVAGTGTTAVVLVFDAVSPRRAMALHAGDSRAYRFHRGKLRQLTRDHSIAESTGARSEDALPQMFRGMVTRSIGTRETVELEETPVDVEAGALFLLCSDGLSRMLPDRAISRLLRRHSDMQLGDLAQLLVEQANRAGGDDNISVVLVRVGDMNAAEQPTVAGIEPATSGGKTETSVAPLGQAAPPPASAGLHAPATDTDAGRRLARPRPALIPVAVSAVVLVVIVLALFAAFRDRPAGPRTAQQRPPTPLPRPAEPAAAQPGQPPIAATPSTPEPPDTPAVSEPPARPEPSPAPVPDTPSVGVTPPEPAPEPENAQPAPPPVPPQPAAARTPPPYPTDPEKAKSAFLVGISRALVDGIWGRLDTEVKAWPPSVWDVVRESSEADIYRAWLAEWQRAAATPDIDKKYRRDRSVLTDVCTEAGFSVPPAPDVEWPEPSDERADTYCRLMYQDQRDLLQALRLYIGDQNTQLAVFGPNPGLRLRALWGFAGSTHSADDAVQLSQKSQSARDDLKTLTEWVYGTSADRLFLNDVRKCPFALVARISTHNDTVWDAVYKKILPVDAQVYLWRQWQDDATRRSLDTILRAQRKIVASRIPYGKDVRKWRHAADADLITELLEQIESAYPQLKARKSR